MNNPFILTGYVSPEYFCDRKEETEFILDALQNRRNLTLISPRKMGKTGLIKQVFHILREKDDKIATFYVDILNTQSFGDFVCSFSNAVMGSLDNAPEKLVNKALSIFKSARPTLTIDPVTSSPKFSLELQQGQEESTLKDIFEYLGKSGKRCVVAFDEFQQIASYPEKSVEAVLRSYIQFIPNASFIFSGSREHMLAEMFLSPSKPFYQSTVNRKIGSIDAGSYYSFASHFFKKQGRTLPEDVFAGIYDRFDGHTWYVQNVLNHLWGRDGDLDKGAADFALKSILEENEYFYQMFLRAYSKGSVCLLKAVAKERYVKEITSSSFIRKYSLSAASSVQSAVKKLIDDEVLYRSDKGYMVYDRFLGEWLAEQYNWSN